MKSLTEAVGEKYNILFGKLTVMLTNEKKKYEWENVAKR